MIKRIFLFAVLTVSLLALEARAAVGNPEKTQKFIAVLQTEASFFDKARACQQLGECGTKDAIPALAALLADEHLSAYARSGLEGIADPSAAEALHVALGKVKGSLLAGVINSLGVLRDANAVSALTQLAADPASGVVKEAWLALGRIATPDSIRSLQLALGTGPEESRPDAAAGCLLAAEKQLADGNAAMAVALYDTVRQAAIPMSYRIGATRGAILARKSDGVPFLMEQLKSNDLAIRNAALHTIREIPSDPLASALNAAAETAQPELEGQLLLALMDCHNPQSLPVIRAKAASQDVAIRKTALMVLGRIGGAPEAEVLLKAVADHRTPDESAIALSGLERMGGAEVDNSIAKALGSANDAGLRVKLIRLLGDRGASSATSVLLQQAADPDPQVSVAAFRAAKTLVGPGDLATLITLTKATRADVARDAAENALVNASAKNGNPEQGGEALLAELKQANTPADKCSWVRVLTALGYAKALPALKATLGDTNEKVAINTITQLGRWPDPAPVEDLLAVLETGTNPAQRKRALASVIQLATVAAEEHQRQEEAVTGWFGRANKAVQSLDDKRLLVSGLGRLQSGAALQLLEPYLDDPTVQQEASLAVIQVSKRLTVPTERRAAKPLLEKVLATTKSQSTRNQAQTLLQQIAGSK